MKEALALFEEARDAIVPKARCRSPEHPHILDNLARMYRAFGRTAEAIDLAEQVRDARVMILGSYHPRPSSRWITWPWRTRPTGKPEKALPLFQQAAAGIEKLEFAHDEAGGSSGTLSIAWKNGGSSTGRMPGGRKWLAADRERMAEIRRVCQEEEQVEGMLGAGGHADAEPPARAWRSVRETQPGVDDGPCRRLLGVALLGQQRYAEAEPVLIGGYEDLKAREGQIPPLLAGHIIAGTWDAVKDLYDEWGRPEKAAEWRAKTTRPVGGHPTPPPSTPKPSPCLARAGLPAAFDPRANRSR